MRRWTSRSPWLFWLTFGWSIALHLAGGVLLLNIRSETTGVPVPPTTAISINLETSDILNSPELDSQAQVSPRQV